MATAAKTTPQDLPPKGGYAAFRTERTKLGSLLTGKGMILSFGAITTTAFYLYFQSFKYNKRHDVEIRSAKLAMLPLLLAERDREFLKQLNRNRKDEAELMKDVPDWEVGTWYGTPVFKTAAPDRLIDPIFREYYVHASEDDYKLRADMSLWT